MEHLLQFLRAGIPYTIGRRLSASVDARGAALGSLPISGFALFVWMLLPHNCVCWILPSALLVWLNISVIAWRLRELSIDLLVRRRHA